MHRKLKSIDFEAETKDEIDSIKSMIGEKVPLSSRYTQCARALLVSVESNTATIRFANGATLTNVPIRDLVDDRSFWRHE